MDGHDAGPVDAAKAAAPAPSYEQATPACEVAEEIRFAVVMYGGVSLAIYINGIAQELLNMVHSSAPSGPASTDAQSAFRTNDKLKGAQPVYRVIAQCLGRWREGDRGVRAILRDAIDANDIRRAGVALANEPIRTRFVVDILSGTSAGGINAIFLAKALANGQSIDGLKRLWVQEGDLRLLINDDASLAGLPGWSVSEPQTSLLNSQRMYHKLLEAFDDLETSAPSQKGVDSSLVGELDLFVTTTDIEGLPLPVKLADRVIYEKRHRNVFHFRYAGAAATGHYGNDFLQANDPFLAFSARCTSSFPFAFDPMRLMDIDQVTRAYKDRSHGYRTGNAGRPDWERFYSEYWRRSMIDLHSLERRGRQAERTLDDVEAWLNQEQGELKDDFRRRAFGDGGYLDNKPFSYATSMLARRQADVPVYRKLLYVEPTPEHPENEATVGSKPPERPDFAENVRAALLDLPTKEMIREDIDRVLDRNTVLARISSYTRDVDADIARLQADVPGARAVQAASLKRLENFAELSLTEMVQHSGIAYGAYHRLRVDDVSNVISGLVARAAQHDPRSHACAAIRAVFDVWRNSRYAPDPADDRKTENSFLAEFDSRYYLRRLAFVNRRINELALVDEKALRLLGTWLAGRVGKDDVQTHLRAWWTDDAWKRDFRAKLRALKKEVNRQLLALRAYEDGLCRPGDTGDTALSPYVADIGIDWIELESLLEITGAKRAQRAYELLQRSPKRVEAIQKLADFLREQFAATRSGLTELAPPDIWESVELGNGESVAHACIGYYNAYFRLYDMVLFPVQYGTGSSESSEVEIYRISPEDATALVNERTDPRKRRKLAGTFLMNFGAFLEKTWRENDMLWGRLDGVERLITAVMPLSEEADRSLRNGLIRQAQAAILSEELSLEKLDEMRGLLVQCLATEAPRLAQLPRAEMLRALTERLNDEENELPLALQTILTACLSGKDQLWNYFSTTYEVDREPNAENAVRLIARATRVTTSMLDGLAAKYRHNFKSLGWVATFASVFWGMIEVAVPNSVAHIFWRHWLKVIYILDLVLIAGGIALGREEIAGFGWAALGVTVVATLAVTVLGDFIAGKGVTRWLNAVKAIVIVAALGLMAAGVMFLRDRIPDLVDDLGGAEYLRSLVLAAIAALVAFGVVASIARLLWRAIRSRL